ncbi:MAG: peptidyl-prolyl cis-trans isomerase [Acidobacteria bacterium]|nr:peptidyl-prolyl cis-trans isomerase [Acidobacteriota bacterium]
MRKTRSWIWTALVLLAVPLTFGSWSNQAAKKETAGGKYPVVVMETSMGTIRIEVFTDKAPVTAKNFLDYASSGFYAGTVFHRVVPGFVIQGGGYLENMNRKPTQPAIKNESKNGLKNLRGALSMARYDDPNSATSQFFINLKDNAHLDPPAGGWGYAVFARVIGGMDVVDKIAAAKTATRNVQGTPFQNVPVQAVVVKSAKVAP